MGGRLKIVWRGHDPEFAQTIATELGMLLHPERAVISISHMGQSMMWYVLQEGSMECALLIGRLSLEVTLTAEGQARGRRVRLTGLPAQRVLGVCAALVNRIQASWCAELGVDEPRR